MEGWSAYTCSDFQASFILEARFPGKWVSYHSIGSFFSFQQECLQNISYIYNCKSNLNRNAFCACYCRIQWKSVAQIISSTETENISGNPYSFQDTKSVSYQNIHSIEETVQHSKSHLIHVKHASNTPAEAHLKTVAVIILYLSGTRSLTWFLPDPFPLLSQRTISDAIHLQLSSTQSEKTASAHHLLRHSNLWRRGTRQE